VSGFAPVEGSDEAAVWIEKQDMFPALLDKVRFYLGEGELQVSGALKSA
jgi:hypothetical protein